MRFADKFTNIFKANNQPKKIVEIKEDERDPVKDEKQLAENFEAARNNSEYIERIVDSVNSLKKQALFVDAEIKKQEKLIQDCQHMMVRNIYSTNNQAAVDSLKKEITGHERKIYDLSSFLRQTKKSIATFIEEISQIKKTINGIRFEIEVSRELKTEFDLVGELIAEGKIEDKKLKNRQS